MAPSQALVALLMMVYSNGFKYEANVGPYEGKANDNRMAQETDIDGSF